MQFEERMRFLRIRLAADHEPVRKLRSHPRPYGYTPETRKPRLEAVRGLPVDCAVYWPFLAVWFSPGPPLLLSVYSVM